MAVSGRHRGFFYNHASAQLEVKHNGTTLQIYKKDDHHKIETNSDTKNVRINSRNFTQTSGDASGVQIKPNQTVATAGITGLEVSPRYAAGIAGTNLVAIKADPVLKGSGTGTLSGEVVGVQVNIDFGLSQTRTIDGDVSAFEAFLAVPSNMTYNGRVAFMRVRTVNIKAWDEFVNFDDANTGCVTVSDDSMNKDPQDDSESGFLKIRVAGTSYEIPIYVAA